MKRTIKVDMKYEQPPPAVERSLKRGTFFGERVKQVKAAGQNTRPTQRTAEPDDFSPAETVA